MKTKLDETDLDLMFFDFEDEYRASPERAIASVQILLLDETVCLARVETLRALADRKAKLFPDRVAPGRDRLDDFHDVIDAIAQVGTVDALASGRTTLERMAALTRDPDALWQMHLRLIEPGDSGHDATHDDAAAAAASTATSPADLTDLAQSGRTDELGRRLAAIVPATLHHLGWDEALADAVQRRLSRRAEQLTGRFRDAVAGWLAEFARERGLAFAPGSLTIAAWQAIVRRAAVDAATRPTELQPAAWIQEFRRTVLARRFGSLDELLHVTVSASPSEFDIFRRRVFDQACQVENELRHELELMP